VVRAAANVIEVNEAGVLVLVVFVLRCVLTARRNTKVSGADTVEVTE